jgi:multicomponent Na+:H+ antiporter subunit G
VRVVGELLLLAGAVFILLGAIGALRFDNIYARMHAAAKVPTLGLLLTVLGAELLLDRAAVRAALLLAAALQLLTGPVSAHLVGRAAHRRPRPHGAVEGIDELARDEAAAD